MKERARGERDNFLSSFPDSERLLDVSGFAMCCHMLVPAQAQAQAQVTEAAALPIGAAVAAAAGGNLA